MRNRALVGVLLILNIFMATRFTLSRSIPSVLRRSPRSNLHPVKFPKSRLCPLWSSSFPLCLAVLHKSTTPLPFYHSHTFTCSSLSSPSMAATPLDESTEGNPLLQDFDFPPFDSVEAKHVRPGIRALLKKLV